MSTKPTADRAAFVDTGYCYMDAAEHPPPQGPRLLCIDRRAGVASVTVWNAKFGFTHWAPLPTFKKDQDEQHPE